MQLPKVNVSTLHAVSEADSTLESGGEGLLCFFSAPANCSGRRTGVQTGRSRRATRGDGTPPMAGVERGKRVPEAGDT